MAPARAATAIKIFAVFAAADLSALFAFSSEAVREARHADPAGLLALFSAMQAGSLFGLLLLALWLLVAAVRGPAEAALRWYHRRASLREMTHAEG